ncbi:MAG: nickel-dependent lactate racemase [Anaerolineae bacterium]|jgi:nickel-dependent lactate racemase
MQQYSVACGTGQVTFTLPPGMRADIVEPRRGTPVDLVQATEAALREPVAGPSLAELAKPGQKVCIVFTDATREVPDHVLVPALLRELHAAGVRREDVTLLCGVGMHRPSTHEEKVAKLGADVVASYRVLDSQPRSVSDLVHLGDHEGIPLWVSRHAVEADLLLATGVVEPHQYAGFSGGRKTVAVGAGGEPTIAATHSPGMIEREGVRLGNLEGNPFHEALTESARRAGLRFVVNVLKDGDGNVVEVDAGEPQATLEHLVAHARDLYEVQLDRRYDIVVAGVGHPKDANVYQASRAVTYVYFAPTQVLVPGGVIIIPAPCAEGVGQGVGEQRFAEAMRAHPGPDQIVAALRDRVTMAGEQRSYLLSRALQGCKVIFVGSEAADDVKACHMSAADTMSEALELARQWTRPDAEVLVAPHSLLTVLRGPNGL